MMAEKSSLAEIERGIIEFWEREKIYEQTLEQNRRGQVFSFYDGPPFASGSPHHGHVLQSFTKDTVTRYWSMRRFRVERTFGWDCHGIPVELYVEKKLGFKTKRDILAFGIKKFNETCRASVFDCIDEWFAMFRRIGRWGDFQHAYSTMDNDYIESVWWVFAELWKKNLIIEEHRTMPYCIRCGTPLSNFEVDLGGYHEVTAPSVFVKFLIKDWSWRNFRGTGGASSTSVDFPIYALAWTTTPWTLPANFGLAVNPELMYLMVEAKGQHYLFAEHFFERFQELQPDAVIRQRLTGRDLAGLGYEPLSLSVNKGSFQIYTAPFVASNEGTGIVHLAPFGAEDFALAQEQKIDCAVPLDREGVFSDQPEFLRGLDRRAANPKIIEALKAKEELLLAEEIKHQESRCWRCDQELIGYPLKTFFVRVTAIKPKLLALNEKIVWVPDHAKHGRFGGWLAAARDWAISRNRFWGAPIPVWQCPNGHQIIIGSRAELTQRGATIPADLHRPEIDAVTFKCDRCDGVMQRVEEVLDCWFESGSMPYAQHHYPFANQEKFKSSFPADFIAEALEQTRGWFYTLHVLAGALFDQPAYRHVIGSGLISDPQGRKLSKKLQNYADPTHYFETYGADTLRYYLLSRAIPGEPCRLNEEFVRESQRELIFPFLNAVNFYETAVVMNAPKGRSTHVFDRWLQTVTANLATEVQAAMAAYDLRRALQALTHFVDDDLNNWYIKLSRDRLKLEQAPTVLGETLVTVCRLIAPLLPFVAEHAYERLKLSSPQRQAGFKASVFLEDQPKGSSSWRRLISKKLLQQMVTVQDIVSAGWRCRKEKNFSLRLPLRTGWVNQKLPIELLALATEALNIKELKFDPLLSKKERLDRYYYVTGAHDSTIALNEEIDDELRREQAVRDFIRYVNDQRRQRGLTVRDRINLRFDSTDQNFRSVLEANREQIKTKTLSSSFDTTAELSTDTESARLGGAEFRVEFDSDD